MLPYLPKCILLDCANNKLTNLPCLPSCGFFSVYCSANEYLYINKLQAKKFALKETPNYNNCAKIIQRNYKNYLRKKYNDIVNQYLFKGPAKLHYLLHKIMFRWRSACCTRVW